MLLVAAVWRKVVRKNGLSIEVRPLKRILSSDKQAVEERFSDYGKYAGRDVSVSWVRGKWVYYLQDGGREEAQDRLALLPHARDPPHRFHPMVGSANSSLWEADVLDWDQSESYGWYLQTP